MKKLTLLLALSAVFTACGSSQGETEKASNEKGKPEVPAKVKEAFEKQFPNVTDVDWEQEGANYEASFENNDTETSVVIDPNGTIMETETEIDSSSLPKAIMSYLDANFKGKKIKEAAKIVSSDGSIMYEVEINKGDLMFNSNGEYIKTETEDKE